MDYLISKSCFLFAILTDSWDKMATQSGIITKACDGALEQIQKNAPAEYAKLNADPARKKKLVQAARDTATEYVELAEELAGEPQDIDQRLAKHLSGDRIKLIQGALSIPTFRMDITKKGDGKHWVELTRGGKSFAPARALTLSADVDWATIKQYASIAVEAVILVLPAVGTPITASESVIEGTVEEVIREIQASSKLEKAIEKFVAAWDAAGGSAYAKAKALFQLIIDSYAGDILWTTIKSLCSEMKWYDWLETAAKVIAMIIASLATHGVALIAEIALIALSDVDFAMKIANVIQLSTIKKTL